MDQRRSELLAQRSHQWAAVAAACFCMLLARLAWIQVVRHSYYLEKAKKAVGRHWSIPAPRGRILDRNEVPLAQNLKLYTIAADPALMSDLASVAKQLAPALCMPEEQLLSLLNGEKEGHAPPSKPLRFVRLRESVDEPVAKAVAALDLPGLIVTPSWKRAYPLGSAGAALLGFVGDDLGGQSGIEARFNKTLAGTPGEMFAMVDGRLPRSRAQIPGGSVVEKEMRPGETVMLTLDLTLQRIADAALAEAVQNAHAKGGTAIIMDPKTGEVLALATQPSFDPNQYQAFPPTSWVCQAVTSPYEPGSTFKSITACAALEEGVFSHGETITCSGTRAVGNRVIGCALHGGSRGHGQVDLHSMIVRSCNVGLGTVALALGPDRLHKWVARLGFGARTGIEVPGETNGLLTPSKSWSQIQTANVGFGQGVSVTPIQLLSAYCTIANGGFRVRPHVLRATMSESGVQPASLPAPERVLSPATVDFMKKALQGVVEEPHGTGNSVRVPGRTVAGKTGTAQKPVPGMGYHSGKYIGSFVGFAPVSQPRMGVIVVIDEPQGVHYGGVVAAPAFQKIMEKGLAYLQVPQDASLKGAPTGPAGSAAE